MMWEAWLQLGVGGASRVGGEPVQKNVLITNYYQ